MYTIYFVRMYVRRAPEIRRLGLRYSLISSWQHKYVVVFSRDQRFWEQDHLMSKISMIAYLVLASDPDLSEVRKVVGRGATH